MPNASNKQLSWKGVVLAILVIGAFFVLLALGTWQLSRLEEKEALLARIDDRLDQSPLSLEELIAIQAAGEDIEYRPVSVSGLFDHANEQHFFATHKGLSGYYVYTPLVSGEHLLFINRGFVPFDMKDAVTRPESLPDGVVKITGLARRTLSQKPSFIVPDNDPDKNIFYWKEIGLMAARAGLADDPRLLSIFVDVNADPAQEQIPVGGVTRIELPNNHFQYALTWYGLAGALFVISIAWIFGRKKRTGQSPSPT